MELKSFLDKLRSEPESIEFADTISVIESTYDYTPTAFTNGDVTNEAGQNEGSCKIIAFAQLNKLTKEQTLHCFGKYYREEVLNDPKGNNHQNIRQLMKHGFSRIYFEEEPLN
jgi:hypothetical protein